MGKRFRNILTAFVAALGLVILVFSSQSVTTKAADFTYVTNTSDNGLLTGMSIDQKNYGTASEVKVHLNWDATGKDLKNGDTWNIQLPDTLKVKDAGTSFPLTNELGEEIGTAVLNSDNTITVTFTNVDGKTDFKGELYLKSGIGVGSGANVGDNDVVIGDFHDNMTVKTSDSDFSKKGVIGKDANGEDIITWTILVNRNSGYFPNLKVTDTNINDGLQTYIPGSLKVQTAHWTSPGYYSRDKTLSSDSYKLDESSGSGFVLWGLPDPNQFYAITYQTKINDPANASNGTKFRNEATYTWGEGSGTTGNNSGTVSGSVSKESNSGNGDGNNILGSATLTKTSTDDTTATLPGATYSVYKYGSDEPVKTDLVTDENGQITISGLEKGDYYFLETKAPDGYQTNGNEIPFTISGTTATAVQVTAEDEPDTKSQEGSIVIMKLDSVTGYRLANVTFDIVNSNNEVVGSITTDGLGIGHYYNLPYGDYTLKETNTPEGYLKGKDIPFTINEENPTPAMIAIENEKEVGEDDSYSVDLQKFDRDLLELGQSVGVAGAEYGLYTEDGTLISTNTTNSEGIITIDGLKPGNYYFLETKAPDGFGLNPDKIPFEIHPNGTGVGVGTLETSDPRLEGGNEGNGGTDPDDNDGNEGNGNTEEPGDNNGNEGNGNTEEPGDNNSSEDEDNSGLIVDPENPGSNNNNNNGSGIITNPINPGNANNGSSTNSTLPQTGSETGIVASLIGIIILIGTLYFKRRNA